MLNSRYDDLKRGGEAEIPGDELKPTSAKRAPPAAFPIGFMDRARTLTPKAPAVLDFTRFGNFIRADNLGPPPTR